MYAVLMSVPFELGFGLKRWEQVYQTMLEKVKGVPKIDKLRVIQIIEGGPQHGTSHNIWTPTSSPR